MESRIEAPARRPAAVGRLGAPLYTAPSLFLQDRGDVKTYAEQPNTPHAFVVRNRIMSLIPSEELAFGPGEELGDAVSEPLAVVA